MLVDYEEISDLGKVWIYPSNRKFYQNEIEEVKKDIKNFLKDWKGDDENINISYRFLHNRFIVIVVDDNNNILTTKDIDESVSFILKLQNKYNIELLDRMNVCFKQGEFIQYKDLKEFKSLLKNRAITKNTIIFDNLISNNHDFKNYWEISIEDSWYNRFL